MEIIDVLGLLLIVVASIVAGIIASACGRSGIGFFLLWILVFSPLIVIPLASYIYVDASGGMRRVVQGIRLRRIGRHRGG
jgi:hypothetical protein